MNIKQLKEMIANEPDTMLVLMPYGDHSYRRIIAKKTTALRNNQGAWTEDHGEGATPEKEYGRRIAVIVLS